MVIFHSKMLVHQRVRVFATKGTSFMAIDEGGTHESYMAHEPPVLYRMGPPSDVNVGL